MARVSWALEQILRYQGLGAFIICDYKYKENYLRNAPHHVLEVLCRPKDCEGSHDILMVGSKIGVVCVQVRIITNPYTYVTQTGNNCMPRFLIKMFWLFSKIQNDASYDNSTRYLQNVLNHLFLFSSGNVR